MTDLLESIDPRPEARPLELAELTEEQREAGLQATRLLRGMTREASSRATPLLPGAHSYLPAIYKEHRSNRIVLLDGARGSGKSALLVTLLDAYGSAVTEQKVPGGYGDWISPADRIIPVGLVDLQPLPGSIHLLFHLVAHLERVVEAMENGRDRSRLGAAAWHPASADESPSRKRWRDFARIAASGWEDNLNDRKGRLDAEAFALEVEQGELLRMDVAKAFGEFVDALVEDYRLWNHWQSGAPPSFVLAIDDADMNPKLVVPLLDLIRKLWHPRLVFLLTGDSDLFLAMLEQSRAGLGRDIYAKAIPHAHRCVLRTLSPRQRLEKTPPGMRDLLGTFPLGGPPNPARPTGTLTDYFEHGAQTLDLLPGRLRHLLELGAHLRSIALKVENDPLPSRSDEAVWRLWQWTLKNESLPLSQFENLETYVRVESPKAGLALGSDILLRWTSFEPLGAIPTGWGRLVFFRPLRLDAFMDENSLRKRRVLPRQITAMVVLATNFIADTERPGTSSPRLESRLSTCLMAGATFKNLGLKGRDSFAWPIPEWDAPVDVIEAGRNWSERLAGLQMDGPNAAEYAAQAFMEAIIDTGLGRQRAETGIVVPRSWQELSIELAQIARLERTGSGRHRALVDWALSQAGLLAAPESGLPAVVANSLLRELKDAFDDDWDTARESLHAFRVERVRQMIPSDEDPTSKSFSFLEAASDAKQPNAGGVLSDLDKHFSEHNFGHWVREQVVQDQGARLVYESFLRTLRDIQLPVLLRVLGDKMPRSLENYLTPLRRRWLQETPSPSLSFVQEKLEIFTKIQDAGAPALASAWHASCEAEEVQQFTDMVRLEGGKLLVDADAMLELTEAMQQTELLKTPLVFRGESSRRYEVTLPTGAIKPMGSHPEEESAPTDELLEAMLRMAHDYMVDFSDTGQEALVAQPLGWQGLKLHLDSLPEIAIWPVPSWSTLFEWEVLEEHWTKAVDTARYAGGPVSAEASPILLDGLAFWLLSYCQGLQSREIAFPSFRLEPSTDDWRRLLRGEGRPRFRGREVRQATYAPWRQRMQLMATPEAGLSQKTALMILAVIRHDDGFTDWAELKALLEREKGDWEEIWDALKNMPANQEDWARESKEVRPDVLNSLRRNWLIQAGIPESRVDSFLLDSDRRFPDHPWVKIVGPWKTP